MQPEAQTTTRSSLAVSAGALEIAIVIQGALEVLSLYLLPFLFVISYVFLLNALKVKYNVRLTRQMLNPLLCELPLKALNER